MINFVNEETNDKSNMNVQYFTFNESVDLTKVSAKFRTAASINLESDEAF
ncbi:hypothetical protein LissoIVSPER_00036 [Lissonota sp. PSUC_FEM 10030012]|nr:hypothetical protein [Lissonota sp. PSUC_FEM 10030012]